MLIIMSAILPAGRQVHHPGILNDDCNPQKLGLEPRTSWFRVRRSTIKLLLNMLRCFDIIFCGGGSRTTYLRVMSPTSYRCSTPQWRCFFNSGELGFEPRLTESKSAVLPLDDSPTTLKKIYILFQGRWPNIEISYMISSTFCPLNF